MTTQNQAGGPAHDEGFRGVRHGTPHTGMYAPVAKGSASDRFGAAIAAHRPTKVEPVNGFRQMIVSYWRKMSVGRVHYLLESKTISDARCDAGVGQVPQGNLQQGKAYNETGCEILKQIADSFHSKYCRLEKAICRLFLSVIYGHRKHMSIGLSGRGAKFFLDRGKQSSYHNHKFSGAFPARAKFHLRTKGKVVNCCSHFWEGANGPVADYDGTRFRKVETGRPNQANESIPRLRSLREDRPVGFNPFPAHMEEGDNVDHFTYRVAGRRKEGRVR